jgi:hypothetical protein
MVERAQCRLTTGSGRAQSGLSATSSLRAASLPYRAREGLLAVENPIRKSTPVHSKISIVRIPEPMHSLLCMLTLYYCVSLLLCSLVHCSPPHPAASSASSPFATVGCYTRGIAHRAVGPPSTASARIGTFDHGVSCCYDTISSGAGRTEADMLTRLELRMVQTARGLADVRTGSALEMA